MRQCWWLLWLLAAELVYGDELGTGTTEEPHVDNTEIRTLPLTQRLEFVEDLEDCIRTHARRLAETFPQWGK